MSVFLKNILVFSICLSICFGSATAQMSVDIKREIDKIIYYDTEIQAKQINNYSVGLLYQDSFFIYHYQREGLTNQDQLNDHSIFELGGLSKVFTASLLEILVQDSLLNYQHPFNEYLPAEYENEQLAHLTIGDLVSHQSTFPKLPYEFGVKEKEINNPYAHYTKTDLLDFYKKYQVLEDSKKEYNYSNINFALLEIAIEKATGQAFDIVLQNRLSQVLNLKNTFIHLDPENGKMPSKGYSVSGNEVDALKFQSFAASEGVKSSVHDLLLFLQAQIGTSTTGIESSLENTQRPMAPTKLNKFAKVAKGWHVVKHKKYFNTVLHSGSTNGHRAFMGFVRETKTAVVVLSNSEHSIDGLGFLVLRMLNHNWKKKKQKK